MDFMIVWALLWAGCMATLLPVSPDRVRTLTQEFIGSSDANVETTVERFYDPNAVINVDHSLSFGGEFKQLEGVELFLYRVKQAINRASEEYKIIGVDEVSGAALVKETTSGTMIRTGKAFNTTLLHVLEWNQITGKILHHAIIDENPSETYAQYQTDAEKFFDKMMWTLFRSSFEDLSDMNSPLWNLISDDIQIRVHTISPDGMPKEWRGKPEVLKGFKKMQTLNVYTKLMKHSERLDAKVLLSTNSDVWVRWGFKLDDGKLITLSIAHYTFDTTGKLVREDIMARPGRPWHFYSFPSPDTKQESTGRVKFEDLDSLPIREMFDDQDSSFIQDETAQSRFPSDMWMLDQGTLGPLRLRGRPNIDILGDMKVNLVHFGEVDEVKFVGNVDEAKVRPLLKAAKEKKERVKEEKDREDREQDREKVREDTEKEQKKESELKKDVPVKKEVAQHP